MRIIGCALRFTGKAVWFLVKGVFTIVILALTAAFGGLD